MECILCKKIIGNDEKNIIIKHNNNNYCIGCYDVIFLLGDNNVDNNVDKYISNNKSVDKYISNNKSVKKVVNNYKCPKCKILMDKKCSKCNLKNPMWR